MRQQNENVFTQILQSITIFATDFFFNGGNVLISTFWRRLKSNIKNADRKWSTSDQAKMITCFQNVSDFLRN